MSVIGNQTPRDSSKFEKGLKLIPFRHLVAFGLIVVTAFLAYSNSFYVPFQFDDRPNVVNNPNYEDAHNSLGLAYKKSKQWDKAIRSFQEELRRHRENVYTHLYLGDVYMEKRECSKALTHFRKALEYPDLPDGERIRKLISSIETPPKNS